MSKYLGTLILNLKPSSVIQKMVQCEYDDAFHVVDLDEPYSTQQFDTIDEDIEIFDMTSLSTLVLLSQNESKSESFATLENELFYTDPRHRLSLAYEKLHSIPKLLLHELSPIIKTLDISHNEFDNIDFAGEFKQLTMFICDHNNITSTTHIPYMPQLELLWMNHCKIAELYPWAKRLQQACPNLRHLSLMGNPAAPSYLNGGTFYEYLQYRLFMISLFPTLVHLDDKVVTDDQRAEAHRLYKRPFFERVTSKTTTTLPTYLRSVTDKVSEILTPLPTLSLNNQKNLII
ncbi:leucine-rich melanocyte differentiation-associated protein-like isoform X1 [Photinus pyralis]|uniref:U2A'/phosphoprotein 32 family A C-terminal domain-containing protein n=1 Tax=Photinus pyralis TaxID=7054 RepID=A0A1Y1K382_PHOPY|nr:leucine-rich melanocyte differentiation-associated protein-like isoform X1 [Photinus pyralis]